MAAGMAASLQRQLKSARQHLQVLASHPALQSPAGYLDQKQKTLDLLTNRLIAAQNQNLNRKRERYIAVTAKLDAMSPLKVLTRGYAMAQTEDGSVLRSVKDTERGERITVRLSDGSLSATVMDIKENEA